MLNIGSTVLFGHATAAKIQTIMKRDQLETPQSAFKCFFSVHIVPVTDHATPDLPDTAAEVPGTSTPLRDSVTFPDPQSQEKHTF